MSNMEMDRLSNWRPQGAVQKLRIEQVATRKTWARIPDTDMTKAALHVIHVIPANASTVTVVNQLDPGLYGESVGSDNRPWFDSPNSYGYVAQHGKALG
jgi:hypothetical protein